MTRLNIANLLFARCDSAGGTLAVEKHLHAYIREKYDHSSINVECIDEVVEDLKKEQIRYFETHRGNCVNIYASHFDFTNSYCVTVGDLCISLTQISAYYTPNNESNNHI